MNLFMPSPQIIQIMATVGPTLETEAAFRDAADAGARWFRLPLGYRKQQHRQHACCISKMRTQYDPPLQLLLDLPSSRPRTGQMADRPPLVGQQVIFLDSNQNGLERHFSLPIVPVPGLSSLTTHVASGARIQFYTWMTAFKLTEIQSRKVMDVNRGKHDLLFIMLIRY